MSIIDQQILVISEQLNVLLRVESKNEESIKAIENQLISMINVFSSLEKKINSLKEYVEKELPHNIESE